MVEKKNIFAEVLIGIGIFFVIAFNLIPLIWGVLASFKPVTQLVTYPPQLFGFDATMQNYRNVVAGGFLTGVKNSTLYAAAAVTMGLSLGALAAFGLDRFTFKGRGVIFLLVVASIPLAMGAAALIVPKYLYFTTLGVANKWYTLPLIYTAHTLPMAIWILKGAMESVPRELDEAAYIDGASSFVVLWRVVLPLCLPALGTAGFFLALSSWNEFVSGSVMVDSKSLKPIQPLLYQYIGFFGREWGSLTAAAVIAVLPILLVYAFFGRLLIAGLTRGAVKG